MKKILYTLTLVSFLSYVSFAQVAKPASETKPATTAKPATDAKPSITTTTAVPVQPVAGQPQEVKAVDNPNAPEITFETDVHDYGTIKNGSDGTCEFKFTNTGKEPLIISNAVGSCGCTVPTYPKEPILKGQSAVVKVHYDTKRTGGFTKTVTITSNAKTGTKMLTIKGTVEAPEQQATDQTVPLKKDNGAAPLEIKSK